MGNRKLKKRNCNIPDSKRQPMDDVAPNQNETQNHIIEDGNPFTPPLSTNGVKIAYKDGQTEGKEKQINKEDEHDSSNRNANKSAKTDHHIQYKMQYLLCIISCTIITIVFFVLLSNCFRNNVNRILEIQKNDYMKIHSAIRDGDGIKAILYADEHEKLNEILNKHYDRMQSILELQFNKMQNDFNFISIWATTITVVFLIFSLYSIFKTDDMLSKAISEASEIHKISANARVYQSEADSHFSKIEVDTNKLYDKIKTKVDQLNSDLNKIENTINQTRTSINNNEAPEQSDDETSKV